MSWQQFIWTDEDVEHLAEHDVTPEEFEHVVRYPDEHSVSHSSGLPCVFGYMTKPTTPKMSRQPTEEERLRLVALREKISQELPDLVARNQMREEARREPSLTGALRRAVHVSKRPLTHLAREIGIEPTALDEFLTGERNLRSDIMDRLARSVGYDLSPLTAAPIQRLADPNSPDVART